MFAALVDLLACVRHPVAILFALHPFPELVCIAQDLLLLLSQPLELPVDFLASLWRLGGLEGRLQLFNAIVHVVLPLCEFTKAIENLPSFALLLFSLREPFLLGSSRPLIFISVVLVGQLELLELSARLIAAGVATALPLPSVAANHLKFPRTQLQQSLIGRLLGRQGRIEAWHRRLLGNITQVLLRVFHRASCLFEIGLRRRVLQTLGKLGRLLDRALLRLLQDHAVLGELRGGFGNSLAADQFPGPVDDFLLQFGQLVARLSIALLTLLLFVLSRSTGLLSLAVDLLERPDLGEEHVTRCPPRLTIGADVLRPEVVCEKLVRRGIERFEVNHLLGTQLPGLRRGASQDDLPGLAACHAVTQAMANQAEIVFEFGLELLELFERRNLNVVGWLRHLDDRGTVAGASRSRRSQSPACWFAPPGRLTGL